MVCSTMLQHRAAVQVARRLADSCACVVSDCMNQAGSAEHALVTARRSLCTSIVPVAVPPQHEMFKGMCKPLILVTACPRSNTVYMIHPL